MAKTAPRDEDLEPRLMGYRDLPAVIHTAIVVPDEQRHINPLMRYIELTPDRDDASWRARLAKAIWLINWADYIRNGVLWGVGDAYSLMTWGDPPSAPKKPKSPLGGLVDKVFAGLGQIRTKLRAPQQNERTQEYIQALGKAAQESLGDRVKDMLEVQSVMTRAEMRGKGYASSLIRKLTDEADRQGRASWLVSSNTADNTRLYNSLGFFTVKQFLVGENNPSWNDDPIQVDIMVREYPSKTEK